LEALLNPRSIALVGASASPEKAGGRRWKTLVEGGFSGPLYPVHPKAEEILGRRAYKSVGDLPGPIDLAVIIVPPADVPDVVAASLAKGARGIVVITAGFGEMDEAGRLIERDMARMVRAAGACMIGPNCAGIFSGPAKVNVLGWDMRPGPIAVVSQSGNITLDLADLARKSESGFSRALTLGNAADLKAHELIAHCLRDPATDVVLAYLEGFGELEGRALCEAVARSPVRKPIVVLKPGRSESGRRATLSHTGSLAGEDRVVEAAFRQYGILRVHEIEEAWQVALGLAGGVSMRTDGVAVLTDGGGHATLMSDALGVIGLSTPALSRQTQAALASLLPERCAIANPVDFAGVAESEPTIIPKALDACLADPAVGAAVMVGHFGGYEKLGGPSLRPLEIQAANEIIEVAQRHRKPVHIHSVHADSGAPALTQLRRGGIGVHRSVEVPAKALHHLRHAAHLAGNTQYACGSGEGHRADGAVSLRGLAVGSPPWLQEPEARAVFRDHAVPVPDWRVVASERACAEAARELGYPVVLKLISPDAVHKSEVGGILLDLQDGDQVAEGFRILMARAAAASLSESRVLVTRMIRGEAELVIGAFRDHQFGPVVMVGAGGVLVELLNDVSFRLAPITEEIGMAMLNDLRFASLLNGYRGRAPIDARPVATLLERLSRLMVTCPDITEVDLNPVILGKEGAAIADVRIVLAE
jgi:acetyltransferase